VLLFFRKEKPVMVSYQEDLDLIKYNMPCCKDHDETTIHSRCHPLAPTLACYKDGILTIKCYVCNEVVIEINVPERYPF